MSLRPGQHVIKPEDAQCELTIGPVTGAAVGAVHAVDTSVLDADGEWYKTRIPLAGYVKHGIAVVTAVAGVETEIRRFAHRGMTYANVFVNTAESVIVGQPLYLVAGQESLDATAPAANLDNKVFALAAEAYAGSVPATVYMKVFLEGVAGFGTSVA